MELSDCLCASQTLGGEPPALPHFYPRETHVDETQARPSLAAVLAFTTLAYTFK